MFAQTEKRRRRSRPGIGFRPRVAAAATVWFVLAGPDGRAAQLVVPKTGAATWAETVRRDGDIVVYALKAGREERRVAISDLVAVILEPRPGGEYAAELVETMVERTEAAIGKRPDMAAELSRLANQWKARRAGPVGTPETVDALVRQFESGPQDVAAYKKSKLDLGMLRFRDKGRGSVAAIEDAGRKVDELFVKASVPRIEEASRAAAMSAAEAASARELAQAVLSVASAAGARAGVERALDRIEAAVRAGGGAGQDSGPGAEPKPPGLAELIDGVARDLVEGSLEQAASRVADATRRTPQQTRRPFSDLDGLMADILRVPGRIAESFQPDPERDVPVTLRKGGRTVRVLSVEGTRIRAVQVVARTNLSIQTDCSFSVDDLAPKERLRRLDGLPAGPAREIARGLTLLECGSSQATAEECFRKSDCALGRALVERAGEYGVRRALGAVLSAGGMAPGVEPAAALASAVRRKSFSAAEVRACQRALSSFTEQYGRTEFAREYAGVLALLRRAIPNVPMYVDRNAVSQAVAELQRLNVSHRIECKVTIEDDGLTLDLGRNAALADLRPLTSLPVRRLSLKQTAVTDLALVAALPLSELDLEGVAIDQVGALRNLPLDVLNLAGTDVADVQPLGQMPLADLNLAQTRVRDISALCGMPLKVLKLSRTAVADLSPLAESPLEELHVDGTPVTDVSWLRGLPLRVLDASGCRLADVSPLGEIATLSDLRLRGVVPKIRDLFPLRKLKLERLDVGGSEVTLLRPLYRMPLKHLGLDGCPVSAEERAIWELNRAKP